MPDYTDLTVKGKAADITTTAGQSTALQGISERLKELQAEKKTKNSATDVPIISSENAIDTVTKAKDTEKMLTGTGVTKKGTTDVTDTTQSDLTKFFKESDQPLPAELSPAGKTARKELDSFIAGLDTFKISNAELQGKVNTIVAGYDARIAQMEDINARREQTFETLGFRTGAQFSGGVRGGVFGGIIAEEERQGLMRVNELEAAKQADITKAQDAAREQNWQVYTKQIQAAEEKYKAQIAVIEELNKRYIEKNKENQKEIEAMNKVKREVTLDKAIADLRAQGITDPTEISDMLNFSDTGELIGDVTRKEIQDSINFLTKSSNLTGASAGIKDFKIFFPDVDLSTPEGYQKYLRFKAQTASAGKTSKTPVETPVTDTTGKIMSFDEWKFTPQAKSMLQQQIKTEVETTGKSSYSASSAESFLKEKYNEAALQYYRDNPSKVTNYSASSIPPQLKDLVLSDISSGATINELYDAYPDVSSSYLSSLYNSLKKKSSGSANDSLDIDVTKFVETGNL